MPSPNTRSAVDALLKLRGVALAAMLPRVRAAVADLDNATNDAAIAPHPVFGSDPPSVGRAATVRAGRARMDGFRGATH